MARSTTEGQAAVAAPKQRAAVRALLKGLASAVVVASCIGVPIGLTATGAAAAPAGSPDAPTDVAATAGDTSATVSWTAPSDNGSAIAGYMVTATDTTTPANGGQTASGASSPVSVSSLTNGDAYTFTVTATNANGDGPASDPSSSVTPSGVPDAPTDVAATAGDASATVSWTAPSGEGSTITGYTVTSSGGQSCATAATTHCVVTGLTNGTAYTFTVTATNANGTSVASAASDPVTPNTVPGPPTNVVAVGGNGTATVTWTAPFDNGLPVTSYSVLSSSNHTCVTTTTSCAFTGLPNGVSQSFIVTATNADGTGPASARSNAVVPSSNTAVITSASSVTIAAGHALSFTVTTSGTPTPTVGEYGMPFWLTLKPGTMSAVGTGKIRGTVPATGGTFTFHLEATNGVGLPTVQTFTINALAVTSPTTATFHLGTPGTFTVTTTGVATGVNLSATLPRALAGLTFHDNGNGTATLSGTPAATDRTTAVAVRASSGSVVMTQRITVSVS